MAEQINYDQVAQKCYELSFELNKFVFEHSIEESKAFLKNYLVNITAQVDSVEFFTTEGQILYCIETEVRALLDSLRRTPSGVWKGCWSPF